jgi:cobalt/nickel transport system permease protein
MHIPDGLLVTPVWGTMDVVACPAVAYLARRAQREFDHHKVPLMGVMGAFIFAAQMINFPVGNGTSGHLVGGALLCYTLGPAAASIVMTAILATQALVFQDGGLLALGTNVFNMAIAGVFAGYLPFVLLRGSRAGVFIGATFSLIVSALLALLELRISHIPMPPAVLAVSLGLFLVSALIEGAITVAVVQALERIQPDILLRPKSIGVTGLFAIGGTSVLLAGAGCMVASAKPDGIQSFAQQSGIWWRITSLFRTPLADYQVQFISSPWLTRAVAGLAGLALIYLLCMAVSRMLVGGRPAIERKGA